MAKKRAVKTTNDEKTSFLNVTLNADGTYDIDTKVDLSETALIAYANLLLDLKEGRVNNTIINIFNESNEPTNNQIAQFLMLFLKARTNINKPVVSPDKVFRRNKIK